MKCEEVKAVLSDYLDDDLAENVCIQVREHLAVCVDCRVYVDTLEKTIVLYRKQADAPVPGEVHARLLAALELEDIVATIPFPDPNKRETE